MRQDVFSLAYQEAKSELLDITCKFEELRQRKERLESVVAVLGPLLEAKAPASTATTAEASPTAAYEPTGETSIQFKTIDITDEEKEEEITDPFQRRLRDALRFSAPRRDGLLKAM